MWLGEGYQAIDRRKSKRPSSRGNRKKREADLHSRSSKELEVVA